MAQRPLSRIEEGLLYSNLVNINLIYHIHVLLILIPNVVWHILGPQDIVCLDWVA